MFDKEKSQFHTNLRVLNSGLSALSIGLFRLNLSFRLSPFESMDERGFPRFDYKNGLTTTVNYEGAATIYIVAKDIINDKYGANPIILTITSAYSGQK